MQQNTDLEKLLADYQSIIHAKKHLANLKQRLEEEEMNLADLNLMLEKEYEDVKKLESLSLTGLFHTFLGNISARIAILKVGRKVSCLIADCTYRTSLSP